MPAIRSSWLIGSIPLWTQQDITIDVSSESVGTGPWYLTHATASISLLSQMVTRMTAAGVAAPAAELLENRLVRLSSSGTFTVTWGSGTQLRDALGFTGDLSGADSYTATNISPWLWSPGAPPTRRVIDGGIGYDVEDAEIRVSVDGTEQEVDFFTTHIWDDWEWPAVIHNRYDNPGGNLGGTWIGWRRTIVVPGYRFQLYEFVVEDSSGTDPVSLPTVIGTFRMREIPRGYGERKIANANTRFKVGMKVRQASEYS